MHLRGPAHRLLPLAIATGLALAACSDAAQSSGSTSAPTSHDTPSGSSQDGSNWSRGLDSRPTRAVADGDRAFVTTSGGGKFPPQLYAVDTATGDVVAHRSASGLPYGLGVAADDALWVAGTRHSDQPTGGGVIRYDGDSLVPSGQVEVPGVPLTLTAVGDEVWVGSEHAVFVVDPGLRSIRRTLAVDGSVNQLVPIPGSTDVAAVVSADDGAPRIVIVDGNGAQVSRMDVGADGSVVLAATAAALWVRAPVGTDSVLLRYRLPDLEMTTTDVRTDSTGGGLVATPDGDAVLVDERGGTVTCAPADGGAPVVTPADDLSGVIAPLDDGRALFATASGVAVRSIPCS